MFAYFTFVTFVQPIFNCFVLQTHNRIPFTAKKKSKLNKLCANRGMRLLFSVLFLLQVMCVTNYFTGIVWMMYYLSSINKISDVVKEFHSDNCFNFKFILWKVHDQGIKKDFSTYLIEIFKKEFQLSLIKKGLQHLFNSDIWKRASALT